MMEIPSSGRLTALKVRLHAGEARINENWSQVQILSDFLMWIAQRKTGCNLIDLRLVKDPVAQSAVDQLRW